MSGIQRDLTISASTVSSRIDDGAVAEEGRFLLQRECIIKSCRFGSSTAPVLNKILLQRAGR